MEDEVVTEEEKFWHYMFYMYIIEAGIYSNLMMQQIGGF